MFFVYLLGLIVTPLSGRFLDHYGIRRTALLAFGFALVGLTLTLIRNLPLIIAGLALFSSGIFIFQAVGTVQTGIVAQRARSSAAGLYVTFYYIGGSLGAIVTGWTWARRWLAGLRIAADGSGRNGCSSGIRKQPQIGSPLPISCKKLRAASLPPR